MRFTRTLLAAVLVLTTLTSPASADPVTGTAWCTDLAAGSPRIDILGDSISTGDAVTEPGYRWHAMLGDSLRSDGAPGTEVWIGGAIDGSAVADYLPGAPYAGHIEFTVHHPSLIILGWGINDWLRNTPAATFAVQYQQVVDRIRVLSQGSTLFFVHSPWVYNAAFVASHGDQRPYLDAIRAVATANHGAFLGLEWGFPGNNRLGTSTPDLVHLDDVGQGIQYAMVRAAVRAMCG
jgi:lysophospholipase L1-like esterase